MKYGIVGASGRMGQEIKKVFDLSGHDLVLTADVAGMECREKPDVVADFSSAAALPGTIDLCRKHRAALVIGTTALQQDHLALLRELSQEIPVVQSFNFATGVNVLKMILQDYSPLLSDWDLEISETHHNKKMDAPSGTAILLQNAAGRDCPTHSLRLGNIPGDHSVFFAYGGEMLTFTHRAVTRDVFATGALRAALFAWKAAPGFYTFEDALKQAL